MPNLVSILIPAYNSSRWLHDSVGSALAQTWPNKEIIIVDDGSKDDTLAVARSFEAANVKVVTQSNTGAPGARNHALRLAQGDFIQWLDADDLLAVDKIEHQMALALRDRCDSALYTGAFGEFLADPSRAEFRPSVLWQDLTPVDFLLNCFTTNAWMNPASWLVSRELTRLTEPWDERLSLDDDGEYFARLVAKSSSIRFVPQSRMYYRRANANSLSRATSDRACESLLLSLQLRIELLRAIEDSPRTRGASLRYLQTCVDMSDCFLPDAPARFEAIRAIAQDLGGDLKPHRLSWKYIPVRALFGWKAVRPARSAWSRIKLSSRLLLEQRHLRDQEGGTT